MFSGLLLPYCRRFSHTGSDFPQVSSMGSSTAVCSCVLVQLRFPQVCSMGSSTCAPVLFYSIGSTACALLPQAPSSTLCTLCSCVIHNVFVHCACTVRAFLQFRVHGQFWASLLLPRDRYNTTGQKLCEVHISEHKSEDQLLPVQDALGPIYLASRISKFSDKA